MQEKLFLNIFIFNIFLIFFNIFFHYNIRKQNIFIISYLYSNVNSNSRFSEITYKYMVMKSKQKKKHFNYNISQFNNNFLIAMRKSTSVVR